MAKVPEIKVSILVNGVEVPKYLHEDGQFIEGRKNSEFTIRVKNNTSQRKLIVPSVDGISTIDGDRATSDSSGFVISPFGTLDLTGWSVDEKSVAKFKFGDKNTSYAELSDNDVSNIGVIGIMAFAEKKKEEDAYELYRRMNQFPTTYPYQGDKTNNPNFPVWYSTSDVQTTTLSTNNVSSALRGSTGNLGTQFGDRSEFKTKEVSFKRGDCLGSVEIFYDDREGLRSRGIQIVQVEKKAKPSAFGSKYCIPPKDWQ